MGRSVSESEIINKMGCLKSKSNKNVIKPQEPTVNAGTFITAQKGALPEEYQIVKTLGSGAFAEVKLCVYTPTGQSCAVKFIHKAGLQPDQTDPAVFLKEVRALKELSHPHILRCYEIYEDSKKFYVVTEFCEGGELFNRIVKVRNFSENDVANIMSQLLSAVAYCHERLVIHRDLKPENILLEDANSLNIKVADFGSSCFLDTKKKLNGCFGSAYYIAPEVLIHEYNEKCDIWSCGVIMFILLTGRPPYPGNDEHKILQMIKTSPLQIDPSNFPGISVKAIDLLQGLLQVDVRKRINAKNAVNHPWLRDYRNNQTSPDLSATLGNLQAFNSSTKLKDAVHVFLATQIISQQDISELRQQFHAIDSNGDGRISKAELLEQYNKTMSTQDAVQAVDQIMKEVDQDNSGDIDYTEFLKACMDHQKYMSSEVIQQAFQKFDRDGSGTITVDELQAALSGQEISDDGIWHKVIADVDQDGNGVIDIKEFMALMTASL